MNDNKSILLRLENLEINLEQLVAKYILLRKELETTTEENYSLREIIKKQAVQLNNFENQYKISKIVASIAPDAENSAELKEKIDVYITEIDKCIAFLSK